MKYSTDGQLAKDTVEGVSTPSPCSITGGAISEQAEMRLLRWGIDTAHWYVKTSQEAVGQYAHAVEFLLGEEDKVSTRCGNADVVLSRGAPNGYGYTVRMDDGLTILVPTAAGLHMGLFVIGGAAWCLKYPAKQYETVIDGALFAVFGYRGSMANIKLRRIDPHFDICGFTPEFHRSHIVSRAKKRSEFFNGEQLEGVTVGKSDIRFRLYDKVSEAAHDGDLERWQSVWNYTGSDVWRFEYQLRGEFLSQWKKNETDDGIFSIRTFLERGGDVLNYLIGDWLYFAEERTRNDMERERLPWWQSFVEIVQGLQLSVIEIVREVLPKLPNVSRLEAQLLGLLAAWLAADAFRHGIRSYDYVAAVNRLICVVDESRGHIEQRYTERMGQYVEAAYS